MSAQVTSPAEQIPTPPDWINIVARKKLGFGDDWRWCKLQWIGFDAVIEGGVPRLLTRGPRKGQPTWRDSEMEKAVVSDSEIRQARLDYESHTGKCCECAGSGKRLLGWSREEGKAFTQCLRCNATGIAPGQSVATPMVADRPCDESEVQS